MYQLTDGWRVVSDRQADGSRWRNLIVEGPGVHKPVRRYHLVYNGSFLRSGHSAEGC
jgi:hypothetical protein